VTAVRGIDTVRATLARLRDAVQLQGVRVQAPEVVAREIGLLAAGGRDVLAPTPTLETEVARAIETGLREILRGASAQTPSLRAGEAVLRRLRLRVAQGGADLQLHPLAPSTARAKGSNRLLVASGALLRGLSSARVTLTGSGGAR
jgi:hypothetical protein